MEENKVDSNAGAASAKGEDPSLWITDVVEGSPAADAGLLLGDAVISFG